MEKKFYNDEVEPTLSGDELMARRGEAADLARDLVENGLSDQAEELADILREARRSKVTLTGDKDTES